MEKRIDWELVKRSELRSGSNNWGRSPNFCRQGGEIYLHLANEKIIFMHYKIAENYKDQQNTNNNKQKNNICKLLAYNIKQR